MPTPADLTTKLKAVNIILVGMGETPIEALDAVESSLAQKAIDCLEEASRSIQIKGWYWNEEADYPIAITAEGEALLPSNTIRASETVCETKDTVQRGNRLYNRTDHTFEFPANTTIRTNLIVYLDWDDLPEFAKHPIHYLATRRFQMRELTSGAIDRAITEDFDAAVAIIEQAEDSQGPANILTDSPLGNSLRGNGARRR